MMIMDLLEYQAKKLFSTVGIPILPSQSIFEIGELKDLQIPYPVVLKSQVKASGRGKAGGIKFIENTIDAIAAAQSIFKLSIEGEYPDVILAEGRYDAEKEFFLAIIFDYQLKCPVLLGSSQGGIHVEKLLAKMETCVIENDFSLFYARRLAIKMGLTGNLIQSVSHIIAKMYSLFWEKDLEVIEINPLGINSNGEVMALDGKIRINDNALSRHPDLLDLISHHVKDEIDLESENNDISLSNLYSNSMVELNKNGNIAVIYDNLDLAGTTNQLILEKKGKIGCCFLLEKENQISIEKQIFSIFEQVLNKNNVTKIFINILANDAFNNKIFDVIIDLLNKEKLNSQGQKGEERMERLTGTRLINSNLRKNRLQKNKNQVNKNLEWVVRMIGKDIEEKSKNFSDLPLKYEANLEEAINLILSK